MRDKKGGKEGIACAQRVDGAVIAGAQRHDMKLVRPTIQSIIVERPKPTEEHPQGMCLDKGYDYDEVYAILQEFGFTAHVRPRGEEVKAIKREAGGLRAPVGGGASTFLAQPLSPSARTLLRKSRRTIWRCSILPAA